MARVSVLILTFNEAANIGRCLESLKNFTDDIVIVDSFSTDETLAICAKYKARLQQHAFVNQALQCNWAFENVDWRYQWILRLDSDEMLPDKLKTELSHLTATLPPEITGIYLNRRFYFMNRWLKHGGIYPHYILRVFRTGCGYFENKTEEHLLLKYGDTVKAQNDFLEDNRNNTMNYWLAKHASLAEGEIKDTLGLSASENEIELKLLGKKIQRTRWLKLNVYARSPLFLRALLYFLYRYVIRLGFLDGLPGFIFYVNQSFWYRFYVDSRIYELKSRWFEKTTDYRSI